ncbi:MAG: hypothetical protein GY927_15005 [bacterium]|nr:hypothetical protein [bacterium]
MESQIYLISLYLSVEKKFKEVVGERFLRSRGFAPALSDVEHITIELFGEYQGHGNDKAMSRSMLKMQSQGLPIETGYAALACWSRSSFP